MTTKLSRNGYIIIKSNYTTKEIKENTDTSSIPIIALTANAMAEHRQAALDGGCDEYETKPVRLPSLLEKIEQFT